MSCKYFFLLLKHSRNLFLKIKILFFILIFHSPLHCADVIFNFLFFFLFRHLFYFYFFSDCIFFFKLIIAHFIACRNIRFFNGARTIILFFYQLFFFYYCLLGFLFFDIVRSKIIFRRNLILRIFRFKNLLLIIR
jgi:hypothetical protein